MLARVAEARERRPRWRTMWIWAAVAAAAVVVLVVSLSVGRKSEVNAPPIARSNAPRNENTTSATAVPPTTARPATTPNASAGERVASKRKMPAITKSETLMVASATGARSTAEPKQPQFPTPAPLNEQERLLLAYVQSTPKQEIETVIAQKQAFQEEFDKLGVPEEQEKRDR
jgi:hypothetical protein